MTIADWRAARAAGRKIAMLTCYDYTSARLMEAAGVPALLVGDSAANVILGHETTLPIRLNFIIALAAAVRRGAPQAFVVADLPFGSYHRSVAQGVKNVTRTLQLSGVDAVKLEVKQSHTRLISVLADAGVAVIAHLGLRPQAVNLLGSYRAQAKTAAEADDLVDVAMSMEASGAAALLLEAVPPEVAAAVVEAVRIPVIGCGAGPACDGQVFVTHDALGLTEHPPRFAPKLADIAMPMKSAFAEYVRLVESGEYPSAGQTYPMSAEELSRFKQKDFSF